MEEKNSLNVYFFGILLQFDKAGLQHDSVNSSWEGKIPKSCCHCTVGLMLFFFSFAAFKWNCISITVPHYLWASPLVSNSTFTPRVFFFFFFFLGRWTWAVSAPNDFHSVVLIQTLQQLEAGEWGDEGRGGRRGHIPDPLRRKGNDVTLAQTTMTH